MPRLKNLIFPLFAAALLIGVQFTYAKPGKGEKGAADAPADSGAFADVSILEWQFDALDKIHELELTPDQLAVLRKLAMDAATVAPSFPKASAEYRTALMALCDALAADDDDKIVDAREKVDALRDEQNVQSLPDLQLTFAARQRAPEIIDMMTPGQLAQYIAEYADDIPDAVPTMLDAMDAARGKNEKEYRALRKEALTQTTLLVVGVNPATTSFQDQLGDWLDRAHLLSEADFRLKRPGFEEEIRKLIGHPDPIEELRHWLQGEMANLLSNPQLSSALGRIKE